MIPGSLQQPQDVRVQVSTTTQMAFSFWFRFLSQLPQTIVLQNEPSMHCAKHTSLASCDRAVHLPHDDTSLSCCHFIRGEFRECIYSIINASMHA